MGLYEAIDFTRESTRGGKRGVVIYTYMSHHQGMSLLALNNVLHRGVMQRRLPLAVPGTSAPGVVKFLDFGVMHQ